MTTVAEQLASYATVVYDTAAVVEVRAINSSGEVDSCWMTSGELPDAAERLTQWNAAGWNIYAGVNARSARGIRGDAAVDYAGCLVADHDDTTVEQAAATRD